MKLKSLALSLTCALALSSCAHGSNARSCPVLPMPPAPVMTKQEPGFFQRMLNFCCTKPAEPTRSQTNSGSAKP